MIKNLVNKLKAWRKNRIIQQHPLFRTSQITIHELLDGRHNLRSFFTDIAIEIMIQEILNDVIEIIESENPIITNRKKLSENVAVMAMYQVLITLPKSESEGIEGDFQSEFLKIDGVSCELRNHIKEIYENVDYIKKQIDETFVKTDDINHILNACSNLYGSYFFYSHVFLTLLFVLEEDTQEDWFKPFVIAMCIYHEHMLRDSINLPDVGGVGDTEALKYFSYLYLVQNGEQYPNLAFKKQWPNLSAM